MNIVKEALEVLQKRLNQSDDFFCLATLSVKPLRQKTAVGGIHPNQSLSALLATAEEIEIEVLGITP